MLLLFRLFIIIILLYSGQNVFGQLSTSYWPNGNKREEGKLQDSVKVGVWKSWDRNGALMDSGAYVRGSSDMIKVVSGDWSENFGAVDAKNWVMRSPFSLKTGRWVYYYIDLDDALNGAGVEGQYLPVAHIHADALLDPVNLVNLYTVSSPESIQTGRWYYSDTLGHKYMAKEYDDEGRLTGTWYYHDTGWRISDAMRYNEEEYNKTGSEAGIRTEYDYTVNGFTKSEGYYYNGTRAGKWKVVNNNSRMLLEADYGEWGHDTIMVQQYNIKGEEDGLRDDYYYEHSGCIKWEGHYSHHKRTGKWEANSKDDKLIKEVDYGSESPGLSGTILVSSYWSNGNERYELILQNSEDRGVWKSWYSNGILADSGAFVPSATDMTGFLDDSIYKIKRRYISADDKIEVVNSGGIFKTGIWKSWYPNGRLSDSGAYGAGAISTIRVLYDSTYAASNALSVIPIRNIWSSEDGLTFGDDTMYLDVDSIKKEVVKPLYLLKVGDWAHYYENGKLESEGQYSSNGLMYLDFALADHNNSRHFSMKTGRWKYYDSIGRILTEQQYDSDLDPDWDEQGMRTEYSYTMGGYIKSEGQIYFRRFDRAGTWVDRDDDGKLMRMVRYFNFGRQLDDDEKGQVPKDDNGSRTEHHSDIYISDYFSVYQRKGKWMVWDEKGKLLKKLDY